MLAPHAARVNAMIKDLEASTGTIELRSFH